MKKLLILFSVLLCSLNLMAYETIETDQLRVWAEFPDPIVAAGTTVNYLKVYQHDDNDLDYTAFNMIFDLPEGFRINKVKVGRETVNDIFLSERASSTHSIACNMPNAIELRIFCDSSVNGDFFKDDEEGNPLDLLFTVGLIAEPTLAAGDHQVELHEVKFVHKDGNAKVPVQPIYYTINVTKPTTGIETVEADALDPDDCYDLLGHKVDPRRVHDIIVVSKGRKYLLK